MAKYRVVISDNDKCLTSQKGALNLELLKYIRSIHPDYFAVITGRMTNTLSRDNFGSVTKQNQSLRYIPGIDWKKHLAFDDKIQEIYSDVTVRAVSTPYDHVLGLEAGQFYQEYLKPQEKEAEKLANSQAAQASISGGTYKGYNFDAVSVAVNYSLLGVGGATVGQQEIYNKLEIKVGECDTEKKGQLGCLLKKISQDLKLKEEDEIEVYIFDDKKENIATMKKTVEQFFEDKPKIKFAIKTGIVDMEQDTGGKKEVRLVDANGDGTFDTHQVAETCDNTKEILEAMEKPSVLEAAAGLATPTPIADFTEPSVVLPTSVGAVDKKALAQQFIASLTALGIKEMVFDFDCTLTKYHLGVFSGVEKCPEVVKWEEKRPCLIGDAASDKVKNLFSDYDLLQEVFQQARDQNIDVVILTKNSTTFVSDVFRKVGLIELVTYDKGDEDHKIYNFFRGKAAYLNNKTKIFYLDDNPEIHKEDRYDVQTDKGVIVGEGIPCVIPGDAGKINNGKIDNQEIGLTCDNLVKVNQHLVSLQKPVRLQQQQPANEVISPEIMQMFPQKRPSRGDAEIKTQDLALKNLLEERMHQGTLNVNARVHGNQHFSQCENQENLSLLYLCARNGYFQTLEMLLDKGADPFVECKNDGYVTHSFEAASKNLALSDDVDKRLCSKLRKLPQDYSLRGYDATPKEIRGVSCPLSIVLNGNSYGALYNKDDENLPGSYLHIKKGIRSGNFTQELFEFDDVRREIKFYGPAAYFSSIVRLSEFEGPNLVDVVGVDSCSSTRIVDAEIKVRKSLTEGFKDRVLQADNFFASNNQKKTQPIQNLGEILQHNICIGEAHSDISPKKFLIENMQRFRREGYEILFMEHLWHDSAMQLALDNYFSSTSDEMPKDLEHYLKSQNEGHRFFLDLQGVQVQEWAKYNFLEVVKAAKLAGIRIVGIDNKISAAAGISEYGAKGKERTKIFNFEAGEIIKRESGGKKWLALMGNTHTRSWDGVIGVADICDNVVAVNISDSIANGFPQIFYGDDANLQLKENSLRCDLRINANAIESFRLENVNLFHQPDAKTETAQAQLAAAERQAAEEKKKQQPANLLKMFPHLSGISKEKDGLQLGGAVYPPSPSPSQQTSQKLIESSIEHKIATLLSDDSKDESAQKLEINDLIKQETGDAFYKPSHYCGLGAKTIFTHTTNPKELRFRITQIFEGGLAQAKSLAVDDEIIISYEGDISDDGKKDIITALRSNTIVVGQNSVTSINLQKADKSIESYSSEVNKINYIAKEKICTREGFEESIKGLIDGKSASRA